MKNWKVAGKWKLLGWKMEKAQARFLRCKMERVPPIVPPLYKGQEYKIWWVGVFQLDGCLNFTIIPNIRCPNTHYKTPPLQKLCLELCHVFAPEWRPREHTLSSVTGSMKGRL